MQEDTTAAYFEAAFAGSNWSGNAGVRLVHTHTTAATAVNKIISVTIANTSNPTDPAIVEYSDADARPHPATHTRRRCRR